MMDETGDKFLGLLNRISQRANNDHVRTAKFLLREKITRKQMEQCTDMRDIFDKLITKGHIAPDNIELLKYLTPQIFSDCDVEKMLQQYERGERSETVRSMSKDSSTISMSVVKPARGSAVSVVADNDHTKIPAKFRKIFDLAAKNLGEDWKVFARLMGLLDHDIENISLQAEGYYAQSLKVMDMWFSQQERASSKEFRRLLRLIPRNDIADDLQEKTTFNQ